MCPQVHTPLAYPQTTDFGIQLYVLGWHFVFGNGFLFDSFVSKKNKKKLYLHAPLLLASRNIVR